MRSLEICESTIHVYVFYIHEFIDNMFLINRKHIDSK